MSGPVGFLLDRLTQAVVCVLGVAVVVFAIAHLLGDPVQLLMPPEASQADRAAYRAALGLDRPALQRFFVFLWSALHGDLGQSYRFQEPVLRLVVERLPATLELATSAMIFAVVLGVATGVWSAVRPSGLADRA